VIVVDNASADDSLNGLESIGLPLKVIRNTSNKGFAAACNQGAVEATADYLLFLNPDTRLFSDSLSVPLGFMEKPENTDVGICGIQLLNEAGQVARSCSRFPTVGLFFAQALALNRLPGLRSWTKDMTDWDHSSSRDVDQVIGAFFLVRSALFEQLTGFDERFFVYFEELDFSFRAHNAGWRSVYLADAQAFHAEGGTSRQVKAHRLFYSLRSRMLYGFKHFSRAKAGLLLVISIVLEPLSRVVLSLARGSLLDVRNTIHAYRMLFSDMPAILRSARLHLSESVKVAPTESEK
jgi:GT2 family glycosyltransferase